MVSMFNSSPPSMSRVVSDVVMSESSVMSWMGASAGDVGVAGGELADPGAPGGESVVVSEDAYDGAGCDPVGELIVDAFCDR
jgi:hypothetical protein